MARWWELRAASSGFPLRSPRRRKASRCDCSCVTRSWQARSGLRSRSRARLCRGICLFSPSSLSARLLLQLPARRRKHQLHQLLGDLRLQAFRVALVEPHHVGDNAAVLAAGEREDLRLARSGQQTPTGTQLVESAAVVDITRARVDDFLRSAARTAAVLLRPVGGVGHTFLVDFALTRRIYK